MSDCDQCRDSGDCAWCPHLDPPGCSACQNTGRCQACQPEGYERVMRPSGISIHEATQEGMDAAIDYYADEEHRDAVRRMG